MKKLIGMLLVLVVAFTLFSACAKKEEVIEDPGEDYGVAEQSPEMPETEPDEMQATLDLEKAFNKQDQLTLGLTYAEVCAILGKEGMTEEEFKAIDYFPFVNDSFKEYFGVFGYTLQIKSGETMYFWSVVKPSYSDWSVGSGYFLSFRNDKLVSKIKLKTSLEENILQNRIAYETILSLDLDMAKADVLARIETSSEPFTCYEETTDSYSRKIYDFIASEDIGLPNDLTLAFLNDKLHAFYHWEKSLPETTQSKCESIPLGITYEELCVLLNGEGVLTSKRYNGDNQRVTTYTWAVEEFEYNFSFIDGVLTNKALITGI